jgi:glycosyltransferase involved in cell wall biosynthesis
MILLVKPIRVYLNVGEHPIYKDLVAYPPKGIVYSGFKKSEKPVAIYSPISNIRRRYITKVQSLLKIPRMSFIKTDADLIHSSRGILVLNDKPWVMDIEHVLSFVGHNQNTLNSNYCRNLIQKFLLNGNCKKIMPHSNAAKKSITSVFPQKRIFEKLETVYPAIKPERGKRTKGDNLTLLFVGLHFYDKGGKEVVDAFNKLKQKYDINLIVKSNVDRKFINENKDITFITEIIPRRKLLDLYASSDIFVFPTYIDTFGMVLMDAMANSLPIVATDVFSTPEIVENGKNGFLVHSDLSVWDKDGLNKWYKNYSEFKMKLLQPKKQLVGRIVDKTSVLIENSSLRRKMGKHGNDLVREGKFSIDLRNRKLKNIYEGALA